MLSLLKLFEYYFHLSLIISKSITRCRMMKLDLKLKTISNGFSEEEKKSVNVLNFHRKTERMDKKKTKTCQSPI